MDVHGAPSALESELLSLRRKLAELERTAVSDRTLLEALRYAEDIVQTVRQPLLVLDGSLTVRLANRSFYDTFRLTPTGSLGQRLYDLGGGEWGIPRLRSLLEEILEADTHLTDFEVSTTFEGLGVRVMLLNARRIERRDLAATTILLSIEDVTDRVRASEAMAEAALTDKLTGLYNRRGLIVLGSKLLERLRRERASIELLFADVDHLKTINDRFGHAEGDRAIVKAARVLRETFRESDIVARYGGDEFLVLLVGADPDHAHTMCSRLARAFGEARDPAQGYALSVSAGLISSDLGPGVTLEQLILEADTAMYREKRRRRLSGASSSAAPRS